MDKRQQNFSFLNVLSQVRGRSTFEHRGCFEQNVRSATPVASRSLADRQALLCIYRRNHSMKALYCSFIAVPCLLL